MLRAIHAVSIAAMLGLSATAALADFKVCNKSKIPTIDVALATLEVGKEWTARGWFQVKKGECEVLLSGSLKQRHKFFYTYAWGQYKEDETTYTKVWEADENKKGSLFCINKNAKFTLARSEFVRASDNALDCESHKFEAKRFDEHDVRQTGELIYNLR